VSRAATSKAISFFIMSNRVLFPREESTYSNMINRCGNPNATGYQYYGGKGIKVCDYWQERFENFYSDMGPRPINTTLDRINVDGNYEKSNCRWATPIEQANNTSRNVILEYKNIKRTIAEWAHSLNEKPNTLTTRYVRGWNVEEILFPNRRPKKIYAGRITPDEIEDIIKLNNDGYTNSEIGLKYRIHNSQISRILSKFKIIKPENATHIKIYNEYLKNKSMSHISEEFKIPLSTVSYAVNKLKSKETRNEKSNP